MCVLSHLPRYWCELQSLGITEELQMEVKAWERAVLNIFVDKELRNRCIQSFVPNHIASKSGLGVKAFSGEFYWLQGIIFYSFTSLRRSTSSINVY